MGICCFVAYIIGEIQGGDSLLEALQESGSRNTFVLGIFICFGFFSDSVVGEMFKQIKVTEQAQQEVNLILDNLEESIIIFNKKRVEFINDPFLDLFGSFFSSVLTHSNLDDLVHTEPASILKRIIDYFRSIFKTKEIFVDQTNANHVEMQERMLNFPIFRS